MQSDMIDQERKVRNTAGNDLQRVHKQDGPKRVAKTERESSSSAKDPLPPFAVRFLNILFHLCPTRTLLAPRSDGHTVHQVLARSQTSESLDLAHRVGVDDCGRSGKVGVNVDQTRGDERG